MSSTPVNPAVGQLASLFGRKWQVTVSLPGSQSILTIPDPSADPYDPQALRVTFDIYMPAIHSFYWDATIAIYNPDRDTIDAILTQQAQGMIVTVSAGYQNGNYAVVWQGEVFQAYLERENVVDLKLTLYCILRLPPLSNTDGVGQTFAALSTQNQIIKAIANLASTPVANVSPNLPTTQLPRSKTVFGNLSQHLTNLAESNNMQWWVTGDGLNFGSVAEDLAISTAEPFVYSPPLLGASSAGPQPATQAGTGSILDTPQQTMYGVAFRVLLDPRLQTKKPLMTVKIDNTQLRLLKRQLGQYVGLLDQDGVYVVAALRHVGDTRGNSWYTEIQGWTRLGNSLAMLTAEAAAANLNNSGQSR